MPREMHRRGPRHLHLALLATTLASLLPLPLPARANDDDKVVTMEKFEVNAARFRWTHAQTPRFEILSNLDEPTFIANIVNQAGQIITLFEKASPLFTPQRDLPVKLIFIQDEMTERLFAQANIDSTQGDFDERMAGSPYHKDTQQFENPYRISALGDYNDEQLVIVKFLSKTYMTSRQSEHDKTIECAADLAVTYLDACAQIHAGGKKVTWLAAALNAMRGHAYGGKFRLPRDFASPVYGAGDYYRTGWININNDKNAPAITLGRYCLKCEIDALKTAIDLPRTLDARKAFWAQFMSAPDIISLGDIFNVKYTPSLIKTQLIEQQLAMQREVHDFMYYCLFGPDPAARAAFPQLALASANAATTPAATTTPAANSIDEPLFQKILGASYAEFQTKMYAYYQQLASDDPLCADNPWGATGLTIQLTTPQTEAETNALKPLDFKLARRSDIARIISDWFDVIGAGATARASLLKACDESYEAAQNPQFLATLGLSEARYGDPLKATALLEKAAAAGIARAAVYRTLARLNPGDIDLLEKVLPPLAKSGAKTEALALARQSAQLSPPPEKQRLDNLIKKLETE